MDKPVICLFGGAFKPPTRAHFEVVQKAAKICNEVKVIISNQDRGGYNSFISEKVWKQYKKLLPENVTIKVAENNSPVTDIYKEVKNKDNSYLVIFGKGEQNRYNSINENREKYSNVEVLDIGNIEDISATRLREAISKRDLKEIQKLIPEGIKVKDFLLNFQLHEIKIEKPTIFPSKLKPYKDKIDHYIKYDNRTEIGERTARVLSYILQNLLQGNWNIPGMNTSEELTGPVLSNLYKQLENYIQQKHLNEEKIPGGLAKGKSIVDLAIHHGKDSWASIQFENFEKQLQKQLEKGIKVEMEHTTSKEVAKEIAMDHLWEDPKYYDKLDSIEEGRNYHDKLVAMAKRKDPDRLTSLGKEYLPENWEELEESKNLGDLYHFTTIEYAANILKTNNLRASYVPKKEYERDFQSFGKERGERLKKSPGEGAYYISFTRDKLLYKKSPKISGSSIRFTVNGTKLSSKYKIMPFFYYKDDLMGEKDRHRFNEGEERIISNVDANGLKDFKKYLIKTELILDVFGDNETYINRAKQLKQFYPDLITLYKEKPMSIEQYEKEIIPTIEPYRDEEFLEIVDKTLNEVFTPENHQSILDRAIEWGCNYLQIEKPQINFINDPNYVQQHSSFGGYQPSDKSIIVSVYNRNTADICRSTFHEILHFKQDIEGRLNLEAGKDGDPYENEANAIAAKMMRKIGRMMPEIFEI